MSNKLYKVEFYVPKDDLAKVQSAMFEKGAGKIGNYDNCAWYTKGTGQFKPLSGSNPSIGQQYKIEVVEEYKVELVCEEKHLKKSIGALKESHPYETPAYGIIELKNSEFI